MTRTIFRIPGATAAMIRDLYPPGTVRVTEIGAGWWLVEGIG